MKRALFIGGGTIAGVAAVLAYVPTNFGSSSLAPLPVPSAGGTTPATQSPVPSPSSTGKTPAPTKPTTPAPATPTGNKTATGRSYSACGYGNVQLRITVANGAVTQVSAISSPNGDPRSQFINKQAIPWLTQQTLAAKNSANIAGVGGATCTSGAWANSLQSALTAAGL
jgi:uncharacterized protein with FMN-binding domain